MRVGSARAVLLRAASLSAALLSAALLSAALLSAAPLSAAPLLAASLLAASCSLSGPEPVREGVDTCHRCGMIIADSRYAAEAVVGGKVQKFDSLEEMRLARPEGAALYVADFPSRRLVPGGEATILEAPEIAAPMDGHSMAFTDRAAAERFAAERKLSKPSITAFEDWYRGR